MEDPEKSVGFLCHKFTTLFSKLKLVEEERDHALNKAKTAESKIDALQEQLKLSARRLESERIQAENEIKTWRSKTEAGDNVLGNVKADREELEVELQMIRGRLRQMQEREVTSNDQLTEAREKYTTLETAKAKVDSEVVSLTARLMHMSDNVASIEAECSDLRRQNQNCRQLMDARDEDLRLGERRHTEELHSSRCQKEELQRTCKALSLQTNRATELANLSSSMELQMKDLRERLDALRSRNKTVQEESDALQKRNDAAAAKEKELQRLMHDECLVSEKLRGRLAECEEERRKVVDELAASRSELVAEKAQCDIAQTKLGHWEDKVAMHVRQLEGYREEASTTQDMVELLQEQKTQLERVNECLRTDLKAFFSEKERMESDRARDHADIEQWKKKAHSVMPQLDDARTRQFELERRVAKQEEEIYHEQEQKQKLQREARVSSEKIKALNRKCDHLMAQVQSKGGARQHFEKMLATSRRYDDIRTTTSSPRRDVAESSFDVRSLGRNPSTRHLSESGSPRVAVDSPNPVEYLCNFIQKEEERLTSPAVSF